ncbi:hypothetical protein N4D83_002576 [Escherichia coli]|nr:hypothetical protein [Escherichia coli]
MQVSEKGKDFAISNVLRAIFTTKSTELLVLRVFAAVVLSILAFVVYSKNELFALYKETRYETYAHILQVEKDRNFDNAAQGAVITVSTNRGIAHLRYRRLSNR